MIKTLTVITLACMVSTGTLAQERDSKSEKKRRAQAYEATLVALAQDYQHLQAAYAEAQQKLGQAHPQIKQLERQLEKASNAIRSNRVKLGQISEEDAYNRISKLVHELNVVVDELRPLKKDEAQLNDAISLVETLLNRAHAKKRVLADTDIERVHEELSEERNQVEVELRRVQLQELEKALVERQRAMERMQAEMVARVQQLDAEAAKQQAMEMEIMAEAARNLGNSKSAKSSNQKGKTSSESRTIEKRMDNLERQVGEMHEMLRQLLRDK